MTKFNKKAVLWTKQGDDCVQCEVCYNNCVIPPGKISRCSSRINIDGEMHLKTYGLLSSIAADPIEKKPLYHFHPGTRVLSVGSWGCNFKCLHCQNWQISQIPNDKKIHLEKGEKLGGRVVSAKNLVELAIQNDCQGISWTYNEPAIWLEYTIESAKIAKDNGLYTAYVTNGFITPNALDLIAPYLDAYRVDVKSSNKEFYTKICSVKDGTRVFNSILHAKQHNLHIEAVTNIIPGYNDSDEDLTNIAKWLYENIGPKTPWHVSRFFPYNKLNHIEATSVSTIEKAKLIGETVGLEFIYMGNLQSRSNTYCPNCRTLAVKRGEEFQLNLAEGGLCCNCGNDLNIIS